MIRYMCKRVALFIPVFFVAYFVGFILSPTTMIEYPEEPASVSAVETLLTERPDCSANDDHPNTFPITAIVTKADGTVKESRNVDRALKIVFGEVQSGSVVHAFCYEMEK